MPATEEKRKYANSKVNQRNDEREKLSTLCRFDFREKEIKRSSDLFLDWTRMERGRSARALRPFIARRQRDEKEV